MQNNNEPFQDRRRTITMQVEDACPPGGEPFNPDHCTTAHDTRKRLAAVERDIAKINTAFVLDDLKEPDHAGHRKRELKAIETEKIVESYKITATTKIIGAIIALIVLLLSSGITTKLAEITK